VPIFQMSRRKCIAILSWLLLLYVFCATTEFAQSKVPVVPRPCGELKILYSQAIQAGNGALVSQLGQQLNKQDCYQVPKPPKTQPAPPAVSYSVGGVKTIPFSGVGPGEGQSTVIPPGTNPACTDGMLLISDDWLRPSSSIVIAHDLAGKKADIASKFDAPKDPQNYSYVTNDHDLVELSDGSVLYLTGAASGKLLHGAKPAWWDVAYSGTFGPGARSNLMVWRSTDCGATFKYISQMDPALMEDGSCANPQLPLDSSNHYNMGGSDGQLVRVDPANDTLYLTFRCVGNTGTTDATGKFTLTQNPLNKTLVAASTDHGSSWHSMGFINGVNWWRFGILPLGSHVAFGFSNDIVFGAPSNGKLAFGQAQPLTGQYGGFAQTTSAFNPNPSPDPYVFSNVWGNTVITRAGDDKGLLLAFPTVMGSGANSTNGYSVFFHDPLDSGSFSEIPAIQPLTSSPSNYVMNVTAIDIGQGPVLLYWADVNTTSHKARMRGRIIVHLGQYSSDFDITGDVDLTLPANFYFPAKPQFFYGDYHTASGYKQQVHSRSKPGALVDVYHFLPLWVDRAGGARFAEIVVSDALQPGEGGSSYKQLQISAVPPSHWRATAATVNPQDLKGKLPAIRETISREPEREKR
jgi:hypothetical protein